MQIDIRTIPHKHQRYETVGDWEFYKMGPVLKLTVTVSDMANEDYEALVGLHEAVEAVLCRKAGISEESVTEYDKMYEAARPESGLVDPRACYNLSDKFKCECRITEESEPGDDIHAPYYKQHQLATSVERMLAAEMGVSWNDYDQAVLDVE